VSPIVPDDIGRYAEEHTTAPPELLRRLAEETRATLECPQMLTGPVEGRFLQTLVFATGAKRVLELGTYSGYSAISMARGLPAGGHIDTCEIDPRHAEVARRYIDEAGYADRITVHVGPALETIERLGGPFDFVFVDADKVGYSAYYEAVLPKLAESGLIAFDNMLQAGRVVNDPDAGDSTRAIVELNDRLAADDRVVAVLLTVRDGVTLVRRAQPT
jgi:predicted O-methyltransferase YrrM